MKTLKYYKKNGHEFAIIERDGSLAIAHGRKVTGSSETWEVIHIQSHDGREIAGKFCEATEYPPSNEQWGAKGWTFTREDQARARLQSEIEKRERAINQDP